MFGVFNRILRIDLKAGDFQIETIHDGIYEKYLSGKGLSTHLLLHTDAAKRDTDPLSEKNCIIFSPGFASNTKTWGSTRYGVYTKSPLTGIYSEAYSGGKAAIPMAGTGFDAFLLEGASPSPVFLEISEEKVKFHDAANIWGKGTYETTEELLKRVNSRNTGAVVIGPAGENLVRFASINNDKWRCAGRTGTGAVLGSKKVKGIVFHGNCARTLADEEFLIRFNRELYKAGRHHPVVEMYRKFGTPMTVSVLNGMDAFPTQYWKTGTCPHADEISADALLREADVKPRACRNCFIACAKMSRITEGKRRGLEIEGPEYETIYAFGGLCMINNIRDIIFLNDLCDDYGVDTISGGNLCALAIEASRRGVIKEKLEYGDAEIIAEILHKTVYREEYGDILANGVLFASKEWGMEDRAVHVKGLEPAGVDPRILKGMGLSYAVSDRGACHLRATFYKAELSGMIHPDETEGKARLYIDFEDKMNLFDSIILCKYYRDLIDWQEMAGIINAITGMNVSTEKLREIAANIQNLTHTFNRDQGLTKDDDRLPGWFYRNSLPQSGQTIAEKDIKKMVEDYWRLRGWT